MAFFNIPDAINALAIFIINALIRCSYKHHIAIGYAFVVIPTCSVNCLLVLLSLDSDESKYFAYCDANLFKNTVSRDLTLDPVECCC